MTGLDKTALVLLENLLQSLLLVFNHLLFRSCLKYGPEKSLFRVTCLYSELRNNLASVARQSFFESLRVQTGISVNIQIRILKRTAASHLPATRQHCRREEFLQRHVVRVRLPRFTSASAARRGISRLRPRRNFPMLRDPRNPNNTTRASTTVPNSSSPRSGSRI